MPRKKRNSSEMEDSEDDLEDSRHHPQRNAANARERARMRVLSKAFYRLKTTLPWVPVDTKLSKLDTLRLATSYIAHLRAILMDQNLTSSEMHHKHPLTLVSTDLFFLYLFSECSMYSSYNRHNNTQIIVYSFELFPLLATIPVNIQCVWQYQKTMKNVCFFELHIFIDSIATYRI